MLIIVSHISFENLGYQNTKRIYKEASNIMIKIVHQLIFGSFFHNINISLIIY